MKKEDLVEGKNYFIVNDFQKIKYLGDDDFLVDGKSRPWGKSKLERSLIIEFPKQPTKENGLTLLDCLKDFATSLNLKSEMDGYLSENGTFVSVDNLTIAYNLIVENTEFVFNKLVGR